MRRGVALYPLTPTILPVVMHWGSSCSRITGWPASWRPPAFPSPGMTRGTCSTFLTQASGWMIALTAAPRPGTFSLAVETAEDNEGICEERLELVRWALSHESLFITSGEVLILSRMGCGSWLESTKAGCGSLHSGPRGRTSTPKRSCTASRSPGFGGRPH